MNELVARLALLAAQGKTTTYGALARDLGWHMADLTAALERLMEQDRLADSPLRSALCEGKISGGLPAKGFFDKAVTLGYRIESPSGFVTRHREALFSKAALPPRQ